MAGEGRTVADVMTRDVVRVEAEHSLRDVVNALCSASISGAPVVRDGRVVGVISKTDVLDFLAMTPAVPREQDFLEWGELESDEDEEDEAARDAAFFTDLWDDAGADVVERFASDATAEWDLLSEHTAGVIMSRDVQQVTPDTPIGVAARKFIEGGIHRLVVCRNGRLEGIVTPTDLIRLLVDREAASGRAEA